jgi:hypothetical protein
VTNGNVVTLCPLEVPSVCTGEALCDGNAKVSSHSEVEDFRDDAGLFFFRFSFRFFRQIRTCTTAVTMVTTEAMAPSMPPTTSIIVAVSWILSSDDALDSVVVVLTSDGALDSVVFVLTIPSIHSSAATHIEKCAHMAMNTGHRTTIQKFCSSVFSPL